MQISRMVKQEYSPVCGFQIAIEWLSCVIKRRVMLSEVEALPGRQCIARICFGSAQHDTAHLLRIGV
jgi:hypothetical protein